MFARDRRDRLAVCHDHGLARVLAGGPLESGEREDFIPGPDAGYWRFLICWRRWSLSQRICDAEYRSRGRQAPIKNLLTITIDAGQPIEIS